MGEPLKHVSLKADLCVSYNQPSGLSPLSPYLPDLYVSYNQPSGLSSLSPYLHDLYVSYNQPPGLSSLSPYLPDLYVSYNQPPGLSSLSPYLYDLYVSYKREPNSLKDLKQNAKLEMRVSPQLLRTCGTDYRSHYENCAMRTLLRMP